MLAEGPGLVVRGLVHAVGGAGDPGRFTLEADFELAPAERLVIQAPSGAGKTTLLRLIAGLDELEQGIVMLDGRELTRVAPPRRGIGLVFQETSLFESMSVLENVAFGLRMRGAAGPERRRQAMVWLERVGLAARADGAVGPLSGGEKQRIALARALIWGPRLLLLDEPFSALDPALRQGLRAMLLDLLRATPVPTILVTHDREDAVVLATRQATLAEARPGVRRLE